MSLNPRFVLGDLDLTAYPFGIEWGSDLGNPENAAQVIDSLLQDGEIIASDRTSNRTITLPLLIEGGDLIVLADAEAALQAETDKQQNVLLVDPGDGLAVPTLFDTFRTQVRFSRNDDEEIAGLRRYVLSIPALPFGRSATEVTDAGLVSAAVPSTVVIQDGSSATNWVGSPGTVSSSSGFLTQSSAPTTVHDRGHRFTVTHRYTYTPGSAVDMSATTYLSVDYRPNVAPTSENRVTAFADGLQLPQVAEVALVSPSGWRRATYLCPDASVAAFRFDVFSRLSYPADGTGGPSIFTMSTAIDNVQRTNQAPSLSTTGRGSVRSFTVSGSARTQGRLAVAHPTAGLGDVIVHTSPLVAAGNSPDLRRWRTAGGTVTADTETVSGSREVSTSAVTFNVPAILLPSGGYSLYARMRSTSGSDITVTPTWTAATKIGSTTFAAQSGTAAAVTLLGASSTWRMVPIGGMVLPTMDVPASTAATVQITLTGGSNTEYDEAFLFYAGDDSALSIVSCGSGTPAAGTVHNRLWVDTPTLDHPRPAIWVGTQADRSDAFHAGTLAAVWQVPSFAPGEMNIFLATTGAQNATVDLGHFPRWLQHAGIVS